MTAQEIMINEKYTRTLHSQQFQQCRLVVLLFDAIELLQDGYEFGKPYMNNATSLLEDQIERLTV